MNILLFGDIIIDNYIIGNYTKIAPEAPIPILNITNTYCKLGCIGNVLNNIIDFYDKIYLVTCINNKNISQITTLLEQYNNVIHINFHQENRNIIIKNRIYSNDFCLFRYDDEVINDINNINENLIMIYLENIINDINISILSDYNKGTLTHTLIEKIISLCNNNNIYTLVDPKTNNLMKYSNATLIKPNKKEMDEIILYEKTNYNIENIDVICKKYNIKFLLNTLGENGMQLFYKKNDEYQHFKKSTIKSHVKDVIGCGDSIISALSIYFSERSLDIEELLYALCKIGKIAVETKECYKLNKKDWNNCFTKEIVVFTNGCFDIVHIGHIRLLKECKKLGTKLILGINSDNSIKRLKGKERPINCLEERINFLNELEICDQIISFDTDTPLDIIKELKPDIIVKGGDYKKSDVIGKEYAEKVIIFPSIENYSTTSFIKNILK